MGIISYILLLTAATWYHILVFAIAIVLAAILFWENGRDLESLSYGLIAFALVWGVGLVCFLLYDKLGIIFIPF